jgi:Protein of unknown function (DUF2934)
MTNSEITATLAGERMMSKYTGGRHQPSHDDIARLAYAFYEARGSRDGQDIADWLSAEHLLTRHYL